MAKMTNAELDEIVKQSLPGYKVSRRSQVAGEAQDAADARRTDAVASGDARHLEDLRRKYLGGDFADDDDDLFDESLITDFANGPGGNFSDDEADDEMIVAVEPDTNFKPLHQESWLAVFVEDGH